MHYRVYNKQIITIFILLLLGSINSLNAKTDDLLESISKDMDHFNEVATVTKQNEHYQPYIISVFKGKELEKLGVSNLKEALDLVPALDMSTDNFNNQTPIFRNSNPLAYGQSKLFIDGIAVNNVFFDAYAEYLSFPIEMIKRIEVVRGPGSEIEGVNAYAGSIKVITYAEDFEGFEAKDKIVLKAGSNKYKMGGFIKSYKTEDLKLFIDFFYQEDDKKVPAGPDGLSQGILNLPGIDNTALSQSGDAPLWLKEYSLGVSLNYKDFSIKSRILNHTQGSAYGINLALPQDDDRLKLPSSYFELGYKKEINDFMVEIKAGVKYDTFDSKSKLLPDGLVFIDMVRFTKDPSDIAVTVFPDGVYGEHLAKQRTVYQSSYLKYSGFNKHIITAGYRFLKEETTDMVSKLSNWSTGDAELFDYTDIYPFFDKNAKRNTQIFSFQDEYRFSEAISFIYGFNYEQTTHKDAGVEPRASMVYQLDNENIFKAIYSQSHRNASWQEMFTMNNHARVGNPDLNPESVEAFEFAYIRKFSSDSYLQTNLFYLLNKDQIYNSSTSPAYQNFLDTDIYGLEFEYKGNILPSDQVYINYSYVTGKSHVNNESTYESLTNVSNHLIKGYYIYNVNSSVSLSTLAKYVGSKDREDGDMREKVKAYSTLDTSLQYKNQKYNYTLTLSAKNIFNTNVVYPSPPKTYVQDYAQERRNFLVSFSKEF